MNLPNLPKTYPSAPSNLPNLPYRRFGGSAGTSTRTYREDEA